MKQKPDVWNNGIAVITLFHSVAVHAQYVAYFSLHSATVVQLFRALEVWVVLGFSQFLRLPFSIDRWKFLGLLGMTGSVLIGHTGIDVVSGTAIAFANFFMPLRNLLTKLLMKHSAAEEIFNTFLCVLQVVCTLYGIACILYVWPLFMLSKHSNFLMLTSALSGAVYNLASITYLCTDDVSALGHAAFSLAKRLLTLCYSVFVDFDFKRWPQIIAMVSGQVIYYSGHSFSSHRKVFFVLFSLLLLLASNNSKTYVSLYGDSIIPVISSDRTQPFVVVPFEAFNDCNQISHLTCDQLLAFSGKRHEIPEFQEHLTEVFCDMLAGEANKSLPSLTHDKGVGYCLRHGSRVGAVLRSSYSEQRPFEFVHHMTSSELASLCPRCVIFTKKVVLAPTAYPMQNPPIAGANLSTTPGSDNVGNWIWRYGFTNIFDPYTTIIVTNAESGHTAGTLVLSEANTLDHQNRFLGRVAQLKDQVESHGVPTLLLGIGIQLTYAELEREGERSYILHEKQREFLEVVNKYSPAGGSYITVRGNETRRSCVASGIANCLPLGCPSLMISQERNLGSKLLRGTKEIFEKLAQGKTLKVAISFPAIQSARVTPGSPEETLFRFLLDAFTVYDSFIILQMGYDELNIRRLCEIWELPCNFERLAFFSDVHLWTKFLSSFDLVLGARIHGTMAGIAAGTPSMIFPTDLRTEELAKAMHVPYVTLPRMHNMIGDNNTLEQLLHDGLKNSDFSTSFEGNRRRSAKHYRDILLLAGLTINPALDFLVT